MDELQLLLQEKINELNKIIDAAQYDILHAPEGLLHINKNKDTVQYYRRMDATDTHGRYIRKSEEDLLYQLAQKEYAGKILVKAQKEQENLIRCLQKYDPDVFMDTYQQVNENKKKLIQPYILSDEAYVSHWLADKMKMKKDYGKDDLSLVEEEQVMITEQGERVRSKSEKILADKLHMMGIPYVYECPFYLPGYNYVRPDFTTLNIRTRRQVLWEHLGMMDQKDYCEKAIKKIETYEKNGIIVGRDLILTYETEKYHLNMKHVEKLIMEYLI